jgi:hypothetical protein
MALALPEAVEMDHHGFPSFRVGGKIFATLCHQPVRLMVKLDPEDQCNLAEGHPGIVWPVPGYWGRKGSTYVDYVEADDELLGSLLRLAWAGAAPKRLQRPAAPTPRLKGRTFCGIERGSPNSHFEEVSPWPSPSAKSRLRGAT